MASVEKKGYQEMRRMWLESQGKCLALERENKAAKSKLAKLEQAHNVLRQDVQKNNQAIEDTKTQLSVRKVEFELGKHIKPDIRCFVDRDMMLHVKTMPNSFLHLPVGFTRQSARML